MAFTTGVACMLCQAHVPYSSDNKKALLQHLAREHNAHQGTDYLVAGCTMSAEERVAIQNVVRNRQPKLIQMEVEGSEGEEEVEVEAPSPTLLEPETTLTVEEGETQPLRMGRVWSEAEDSPARPTPPREKKCRDCEFTCMLQIQMNRHKEKCVKREPGQGSPMPLKKWKLKLKAEKGSLASPGSGKGKTFPKEARRASEGCVKNGSLTKKGSVKKAKASPYAEPGQGVPCSECQKEFRNQAVLDRHFEDLHQPGEFPCPGEQAICGKVFTSRNKMSSHYSRNCNPNNPAGAQAIARRRASMGV